MKCCPKCQRIYPDDLRFCLDDGAGLLNSAASSKSPPATLRINAHETNQAARAGVVHHDVVRTNQSTEIRTLLPWTIAGGAILLLVIMGIVVIVVLVLNQRPARSANSSGSNYNQSNNNVAPRKTTQASADSIQIAGTKWEGIETTGKYYKYEFQVNGRVNDIDKSSWHQDGNKVTWEMNDGYAHFEGTLVEGRLVFSAYNVNDFKWTGSFTRVQ